MGGPCTIDGKKYRSTDNFAQIPFQLKGKEWVSCEQYFQAQKYPDESYQEVIRAEKDGMKQWVLGQSRKHRIVKNWEKVKVDIMYEANKAKFLQHPDLAAELIATSGSIRPGGDPFWSIWNGVILTRIREELRPDKQKVASQLDRSVQMMDDYRVNH